MGTISHRGSREMTNPPVCWDRWRGKPYSSRASSRVRRRRRSSGSNPSSRARSSSYRLRPDRCHGEQPVDRVLAEPHGLAGVAQRAADAVGHHRRGQPGPFAAVLAVDVLDDLLAAFVLEIHVDVGRFVTLGGDEALEQQIDAIRVDRGDLQAVAHRRVGGRAASLAQNAHAAGGPDDVGDGEEIGGVFQLADERQLVFERRPHSGAGCPRDSAGPRLPRSGISSSRRGVRPSPTTSSGYS